MLPWILLILTLIFAYLTYDALTLVAPALPYSEIAKKMGQDLSHLTVSGQEKLNQYPNRIRLGDINQTGWVFGIVTVGFAIATIRAFLE
jgi:hypothetical protein